jgi:hypothetical protein
VPLFRGSSKCESLILSHHPRFTCECNEEEMYMSVIKRFRGGLVFKANRLCAPLNSELESNKDGAEKNPKHENRYPEQFAVDCSCRLLIVELILMVGF